MQNDESTKFERFGQRGDPTPIIMGNRRIESGSEAGAVRRSCMLLLTWNLLGDDRLRRVLTTVSTLADGHRARRPTDEARLKAAGRILLSLQTGRAARG